MYCMHQDLTLHTQTYLINHFQKQLDVLDFSIYSRTENISCHFKCGCNETKPFFHTHTKLPFMYL